MNKARRPGRAIRTPADWRWPLTLAFLLYLAMPGPVGAFEPAGNETENLLQCERQMCQLIIEAKPDGPDFACRLAKTWNARKIKDGIERKRITWSLGDARCALDISLSRSDLVNALTKPDFELQLPKQTVNCEVEWEKQVMPIVVSLAPKIRFKEGYAKKAWIGVSSIEAPALIKGAVWTVAQLEDVVGVFHGDTLKEINGFIHNKCPARYPELVKK